MYQMHIQGVHVMVKLSELVEHIDSNVPVDFTDDSNVTVRYEPPGSPKIL